MIGTEELDAYWAGLPPFPVTCRSRFSHVSATFQPRFHHVSATFQLRLGQGFHG